MCRHYMCKTMKLPDTLEYANLTANLIYMRSTQALWRAYAAAWYTIHNVQCVVVWLFHNIQSLVRALICSVCFLPR